MILPSNLDVERLVLALPMVDEEFWDQFASQVQPEDFSLESHRRIWTCYRGMAEARKPMDRMSVIVALQERQWLESIGGVSYLVSLDDGMPRLAGVENYIQTLVGHSTRRRAMLAATEVHQRAQDFSVDPAELTASAERSFAEIGRRSVGKAEYASAEDYVDNYPKGFDRMISPNKFADSVGIRTPWPGLDRMIGGLRGGELIIVAARPSMGKSVVVQQIGGFSAVRLYKSVGSISLEMTPAAQIRRMACQLAHVDATEMAYGRLQSDDRAEMMKAVRQLTASKFYFDMAQQNTHQSVTAAAIRLHAKHGLDLLLIDHLHLMSGKEKEVRQRISATTRALKELAMKLEIPIILVSQLSRSCESRPDKRPLLSDLREDGSIEQDADIVLFIYRGEVYNPDDFRLKGTAELNVAKQRDGKTGRIDMTWIANQQRFEERSYEV